MKTKTQSSKILGALCFATLSVACGADGSLDAGASAGAGDQGAAPNTQSAAESPTVLTHKAEEVRSLASARGISLAEADERLGWQDRAPQLFAEAEQQLDADFGGTWIDVGDHDRLKVGVTSTGQAAGRSLGKLGTILQTASRLNLDNVVDVVEVERSWRELNQNAESIGSRFQKLGAVGFSVGVATDKNAVRISVPGDRILTAEEHSLIQSLEAEFGDGVITDIASASPSTQACVYPFCDAPLRGGVKLLNPVEGENFSSVCTGAFIAQSRVDEKLYQFTAGHCAVAQSDTWHTRLSNNTTKTIGSVHNHIYGEEGDMAIIRITDVDGWDPQPWVQVTDSDDTVENDEYTISSEASSSIGTRVCITGGNYGATDCGEVTELNVTVTYTDGTTLKKMGKANYCAIGGDSGGPVYASHKAFGIHSGGSSAGCTSFYQGIKSAEDKMNVDVIH